MTLGRTDSSEGVYKIVAALVHLKGWIENTYWPAFQANFSNLASG